MWKKQKINQKIKDFSFTIKRKIFYLLIDLYSFD